MLKGVDQSLRVRQVKVLGDTVYLSVKKSATQIQQLNCEAETLKVFRILTSQVIIYTGDKEHTEIDIFKLKSRLTSISVQSG